MLRWTKSDLKQKSQEPEPPRGTAPVAPPVRSEMPAAAPAAKRPSGPKSLPQLLLEQGQVTREQLEHALAKQKETGAFLGEILVEEKILDEKSFLSFLAKFCKIPHLSLLDYLIDERIVELVPKETCQKYRLLPIDKMGRNLTVAMVNPLNAEALQAVRECCPDLQIKPILCAHNHFETVFRKFYAVPESAKKSAELSLTSFGLKRSPLAPVEEAPAAKVSALAAEAPAPPVPETQPAQAGTTPPAAPAPEPVTEEEIPDALEMIPEAQEMDEDTVVDHVFHGSEGSGDTDAVPEKVIDGDASGVMHEVTSVMMDSMRDTYAVLARRVELFHGVDPEDVAKLFSRGITSEFQAGKTIFEKGQPGDALYVILGGEILIHDGPRELAKLTRGDLFGEMALVSNQPRSASARAVSDASLLGLNLEIINHVMPPQVSIRLLTNILITVSERLRHANAQLQQADPASLSEI